MQVEDRLYEVTKISFFSMTIEGEHTDLTVDDVPEDEVWNLGEFKNYKVRLNNGSGKAEIVDIEKFRNKRQ